MPGFPSSLGVRCKDRATQTACCQSTNYSVALLLLPCCRVVLCWPNDKLDIENSILIDRRSPPNDLRARGVKRITRVGQLKLPFEP